MAALESEFKLSNGFCVSEVGARNLVVNPANDENSNYHSKEGR